MLYFIFLKNENFVVSVWNTKITLWTMLVRLMSMSGGQQMFFNLLIVKYLFLYSIDYDALSLKRQQRLRIKMLLELKTKSCRNCDQPTQQLLYKRVLLLIVLFKKNYNEFLSLSFLG